MVTRFGFTQSGRACAILMFLESCKPHQDDEPFLKLLIKTVQLKIEKAKDELQQSQRKFERELEEEREQRVERGKHGEIIDVGVDEDEDMEERYRYALEKDD